MQVIKLNEFNNTKLVLDDIELVMSDYKKNSLNTYTNYMSHYKEFFNIVFGKGIEWISKNDIENLTYKSILKYRDELSNKNNNKTINIKTSSISSLISELIKLGYNIDKSIVDVKPLPIENNSYGSLTEDEMNDLFDYCIKLPSNQKPLVKRLFFETAYITAIRVGALLKMTWDDIHVRDVSGNTLYIIEVKDKGKITQTPIPERLYNDLKLIKNNKDNRVFLMTRKTLSNTLNNFCKKYNIDESRNIVLHSIKKASIDKVYNETKDVNITARHGHHNSLEMVYKVYQGKNEGLLERPSINLFDIKDELNYNEFSKEELIMAINKLSISSKNELNNILKGG